MFPILYLMCALTAPPQLAANTQTPRESCLERRQACVNSCVKQRQTCDRENPTDAKRCIEQEKACESKCKADWKRCYEDLEKKAKGK